MTTRLISTAALRRQKESRTGANFFLSSLSVLRRRIATKMRGTELIVHTLTTLSLRPLASSVCLSFRCRSSCAAFVCAVSHGNLLERGVFSQGLLIFSPTGRERERALLGATVHNGGSRSATAARTPHHHALSCFPAYNCGVASNGYMAKTFPGL